MNGPKRFTLVLAAVLLLPVLAACRSNAEPTAQLTQPFASSPDLSPPPMVPPPMVPPLVPPAEAISKEQAAPTLKLPATTEPSASATSTIATSSTGVATSTALPTATTTQSAAPVTPEPASTLMPTETSTGAIPPPAEVAPTQIPPPSAKINFFESDVTAADPGDPVLLSWSTTSAVSVTLWHLMPSGQFGSFWEVPLEGTFEYDVGSGERNGTSFMLYASGASGDHVNATLTIILRCTGDWYIPAPPDICPYDPPLVSAAAEQHFERGIMIWVESDDRVVVLFDDGALPRYDVFQDEWDPGEPESDPSLSPPPGQYQPVRGFGLVWREAYGDIRGRLGWAVDAETTYETIVQRTSYSKYNSTYVRALDGDIWWLKPERSAWEKLPSN